MKTLLLLLFPCLAIGQIVTDKDIKSNMPYKVGEFTYWPATKTWTKDDITFENGVAKLNIRPVKGPSEGTVFEIRDHALYEAKGDTVISKYEYFWLKGQVESLEHRYEDAKDNIQTLIKMNENTLRQWKKSLNSLRKH